MNNLHGTKTALYTVVRLLLCACMLSSCSLDYETTSQAQVQSPEFIFHNVHFTRVDRNTAKIETSAAKLEQYSGINAMYGEDVHFILYDERGNTSVEGSCALLAADKEAEMYYLFSRIRIHSREHRARISAENLRWNGKSEILDSGKRDRVRIAVETETGTLLETEGTGFSARKKDLSYAFAGNIRGSLYEAETEEPEKQSDEHTEAGTEDKEPTEPALTDENGVTNELELPADGK
ncbi:LPS export ABC transporter periplasmic protein LptC [Treponema sp. HNW]|uniref:LPS export ABC transporter periplasmic protein LptC n=1 Tax=Treponema sp. HNW TaxID=3116654 RepID=UPI003D12D20C